MATCYSPIEQSSPEQIAIGDINGDAKNDMIAVYMGDNGTINGPGISVYLNKGSGTFAGATASVTLSVILSSVLLTDVNNDGKADIVAYVSYNQGMAYVLTGNGDGTFAMPAQLRGRSGFTIPNAREAMRVADFLGNGLKGIGVVNRTSNTIDVIAASCKM